MGSDEGVPLISCRMQISHGAVAPAQFVSDAEIEPTKQHTKHTARLRQKENARPRSLAFRVAPSPGPQTDAGGHQARKEEAKKRMEAGRCTVGPCT